MITPFSFLPPSFVGPEGWLTAQEEDRQKDQQDRTDHLVLNQRSTRHMLIAKNVAQRIAAHLRWRQLHHLGLAPN